MALGAVKEREREEEGEKVGGRACAHAERESDRVGVVAASAQAGSRASTDARARVTEIASLRLTFIPLPCVSVDYPLSLARTLERPVRRERCMCIVYTSCERAPRVFLAYCILLDHA